MSGEIYGHVYSNMNAHTRFECAHRKMLSTADFCIGNTDLLESTVQKPNTLETVQVEMYGNMH